ncbi:rhamnogalacturonan endolyase family protein [Actinopolymorpha pittospori]
MVAVPTADGMLVSWRLLPSDDPGIAFHVQPNERSVNR